MDIQLARELIRSGAKLLEVKERTGVTQAAFYQIKREGKPVDFGCVVCGGKRKSSKLFCNKHRWRYVYKPAEHKRIKSF